jgi:rhodanese-related sulfurtransferase
MRRALGLFGLVVFLIALSSRPALAFHAGVGAGTPPVVPVEMAQRLLDAGEHPVFVDLRPAEEFKAGRLPGARSIPFWDVLKRYAEIPRTGRVILYCSCPLKDVEPVYQFLWDQGYRNISFLGEGYPGWAKLGYQVER